MCAKTQTVICLDDKVTIDFTANRQIDFRTAAQRRGRGWRAFAGVNGDAAIAFTSASIRLGGELSVVLAADGAVIRRAGAGGDIGRGSGFSGGAFTGMKDGTGACAYTSVGGSFKGVVRGLAANRVENKWTCARCRCVSGRGGLGSGWKAMTRGSGDTFPACALADRGGALEMTGGAEITARVHRDGVFTLAGGMDERGVGVSGAREGDEGMDFRGVDGGKGETEYGGEDCQSGDKRDERGEVRARSAALRRNGREGRGDTRGVRGGAVGRHVFVSKVVYVRKRSWETQIGSRPKRGAEVAEARLFKRSVLVRCKKCRQGRVL